MHLLVNKAWRANRMETYSISDLARHSHHVGANRSNVDRYRRMVDRPRVKQRDHQAQVVVLALEVQLGAVLPAVPHCPHRHDVVAHPRRRSVPIHAEAAPYVATYLRAQSEYEPALRQLL